MEQQIPWIEGTCLGVKAYSAEYQIPQIHKDVLEIIYCVRGSVKFFYSYEEFSLEEGEFISVDKDAYYLYDGKDNVCVSFYFDLDKLSKKFPYVKDVLFICEGTKDSEKEYPLEGHIMLKGALLSLLYYIVNEKNAHTYSEYINSINNAADNIMKIMINKFDIIFYYTPRLSVNEVTLERYHKITHYIITHSTEKLSLSDVAKEMHLTPKYLSEFMGKTMIGYQNMVTYIRANLSESYLLNTDMTIVEISEACGFSDVKYYYKAFHKWYRCTPGEFREKYSLAKKCEMVDGRMNLAEINNEIVQHILKHYLEIHMVNY